jgi:hypothetical protein
VLAHEAHDHEGAERKEHRRRDGETQDEPRRTLRAGRIRAEAIADGGRRAQRRSPAAFEPAVPLSFDGLRLSPDGDGARRVNGASVMLFVWYLAPHESLVRPQFSIGFRRRTWEGA